MRIWQHKRGKIDTGITRDLKLQFLLYAQTTRLKEYVRLMNFVAIRSVLHSAIRFLKQLLCR